MLNYFREKYSDRCLSINGYSSHSSFVGKGLSSIKILNLVTPKPILLIYLTKNRYF